MNQKRADKEQIIIFGAGGRLKKYISLIENMYTIKFICDNDRNRWNQTFGTYQIENPKELLKYPDIKVIILSTYEKEIYMQLRQMGLKNVHTLYGLPQENECFPHRSYLYDMIENFAVV